MPGTASGEACSEAKLLGEGVIAVVTAGDPATPTLRDGATREGADGRDERAETGREVGGSSLEGFRGIGRGAEERPRGGRGQGSGGAAEVNVDQRAKNECGG